MYSWVYTEYKAQERTIEASDNTPNSLSQLGILHHGQES